MNIDINKKYEALKRILRESGNAVIAYSGGVDSTLLLKVAYGELGDKVIALIGKSESMPKHEFEAAINVARIIGVNPIVLETNEICSPIYKSNPVDRCYHCKKIIFDTFGNYMTVHGFENLMDGSNYDDLKDYRPGKKALEERGVISPLRNAGFTKSEIRVLSKELDLPTWEKEAMACLSTRISYGDEITIEKLEQIEGAELFLSELGFKNIRVRLSNKDVRIEVNCEQVALFFKEELLKKVTKKLKSIGFNSISVDLEGYKMGGGINLLDTN